MVDQRYPHNVSASSANAPPMLGPGGITGHASSQPAPIAQTDDQVAQWGAEAGRLARRARYAAQLPAPPSDGDFPLLGPGGITTAAPAARASAAVGVPERYLSALVGHESAGDTDAQAQTSSATGQAQFTDQTWFNVMGANAARYGQPEIAASLSRASDGHYKLTNSGMRDTILDLRRDPTWAALMTGEYARENDLAMRPALGRDLSQGEVYLGHWLGPAEATRFLGAYDHARRSSSGRGAIARSVVSDATFQANMPIFYTPDARFRMVDADNGRKRFIYDGGGRLRSVTEVYHAQTAPFSGPFIPQARAGSTPPAPAGPPP